MSTDRAPTYEALVTRLAQVSAQLAAKDAIIDEYRTLLARLAHGATLSHEEVWKEGEEDEDS